MVKVGDKIPSATLKTMGDSGMQDITTEELTTGKKVRT
jgi:peroxiredoxin